MIDTSIKLPYEFDLMYDCKTEEDVIKLLNHLRTQAKKYKQLKSYWAEYLIEHKEHEPCVCNHSFKTHNYTFISPCYMVKCNCKEFKPLYSTTIKKGI